MKLILQQKFLEQTIKQKENSPFLSGLFTIFVNDLVHNQKRKINPRGQGF